MLVALNCIVSELGKSYIEFNRMSIHWDLQLHTRVSTVVIFLHFGGGGELKRNASYTHASGFDTKSILV
jgi:hypothetical protein